MERGEKFGKELGRVFLLRPWLLGVKYPKKIMFCVTNTVISLAIVIITESKKIPSEGLVKFLNCEVKNHNMDSNVLKLWIMITCMRDNKILKLWDLMTMQDG